MTFVRITTLHSHSLTSVCQAESCARDSWIPKRSAIPLHSIPRLALSLSLLQSALPRFKRVSLEAYSALLASLVYPIQPCLSLSCKTVISYQTVLCPSKNWTNSASFRSIQLDILLLLIWELARVCTSKRWSISARMIFRRAVDSFVFEGKSWSRLQNVGLFGEGACCDFFVASAAEDTVQVQAAKCVLLSYCGTLSYPRIA